MRLAVAGSFVVLAAMVFTAPRAEAETPTEATTPKRRLEVCMASFEEAQLKQRRGKLVYSRKLFNDCSAEVCPSKLRDDCIHRRDEIERAVPTVSFVVRDGSGKDVDSKIRVDGEPFTATAGYATPIDPGAHDVEFTIGSGGAQMQTQKVTIYEGEKSRVVVLTGAAVTPAAPPPADRGVQQQPESGLPVGPILLGAAGVIALGVGVAFFAKAEGEASDRDDARASAAKPGQTNDQQSAFSLSADSHGKSATNDQVMAFVVGGGGILALAGAAVWFYVDRQDRRQRTAFAPYLTPTFAGASLSARF